jgi:drug/metabolite transporter, DME family
VRLRGERDLLSAERPAALRASALLIAGAALWGTTGSSQALLDGAVPPSVVGALRILVGGTALLLVAARELPSAGPVLRRSALPLLAAALAVAAYQLTFFTGVRATGIAVGTILTVGSAPFFAGALSLLTGRHRPSKRWALTTSIAVVGLALLVRPEEGTEVAASGVIASLAAGLAFATYTVLAKELLVRGVPRLTAVALPFLVGGILLLPVLLVGLTRAEDPAVLRTPRGLVVVIWLGVGATAAAYLLFTAGLRHVPAVTGTTLALAEPLTAALLGVLVFAERLGTVALAGATVVALALVIAARRPEIDRAPVSPVSPVNPVNPAR